MGGSNLPQALPNHLISLHFIRISTVLPRAKVTTLQYVCCLIPCNLHQLFTTCSAQYTYKLQQLTILNHGDQQYGNCM